MAFNLGQWVSQLRCEAVSWVKPVERAWSFGQPLLLENAL
jgi:hypothetical protein